MADDGEVKFTFETDTFSHPNTTTETDLVEFTLVTQNIGISLDMINFTQDTTIRVFEKIDGTNYRQRPSKIYPTDYSTGQIGIEVILDGRGRDMKITLESAVVEGGATSIPAVIRTEYRI